MTNTSLKVSVIVPLYNTIRYIDKCVHSLMAQSYRNFEIIFIDDASTDSTLKLLNAILEEYPEKKGDCQIIKNRTNRGVGYCRKVGMREATGDYMIHVDSDDYVDENYLEVLVNKAIDTQADIVICNTADVIEDKICANNIENITQKSELIKRLLIGTFHNSLWNKLINSRIIQDNKIYPESTFRNMEDKSVLFKCVYYANKIAYVNDVLYFYRISDNSLSKCNQKTLVPILNRLVGIVDDFFMEHEPDDVIQEGIDIFKVGVTASLLLYGNNNKKDPIKPIPLSLIFRNTYIPRYYRYALLCHKFHIPFVVKIMRMIISHHNRKNDKG